MRGVRTWSESALKRRTKMGIGTGSGAGYTSAIRVQDFSSTAPQTRLPLLGRMVHAHSGLERGFLLVKKFESELIEYRDNAPMARPITLGLAQAYGIAHPLYPKTKMPVVMTLDAVISERMANGTIFTAAYDVKPYGHLNDERVMEKLSIHRGYCEFIGMKHFVYTEKSAPEEYVANVDTVHAALPTLHEVLPVPNLFTFHPRAMLQELMSAPRVANILQFCQDYDRRHALPVGNALRVFKNLIWMHCVRIDLTKARMFLQPLPSAKNISVVDRQGVVLA